MRALRLIPVALIIGSVVAGCAAEPADTSAPTAVESDTAPTPHQDSPEPTEPSAEATQLATPSESAEAVAACDFLLGEGDAPDGTTPGEPRMQTLDDLRADAEGLEAGSPGRAAADMNVAAYESMGLVERCARSFNDAATGASFSSTALVFEDETGPEGYLEFLMEGCEAAELPSSATVDATAIVCSASFPPFAYLVVTDGTVAQAVSAGAPPGGTFDQAAVLQQALELIEAVPTP